MAMPRGRIRPKRGGDKRLDAWRQAMKEAPAVLKEISRQQAEESVNLIKQGFRDERDPYGQPWAPKQRDDGRKVLSGRTSRLKGGWHVVKSDKRGFTVAPSVDYAGFHQRGTRFMVRRAMVPYRGIPPSWERPLDEVATEVLRDHFSLGDFSGKGMSFITAKLAGLKRRFGVKGIMRKALRAVSGGG